MLRLGSTNMAAWVNRAAKELRWLGNCAGQRVGGGAITRADSDGKGVPKANQKHTAAPLYRSCDAPE